MANSRKYCIATGRSRRTGTWRNESVTWDEFVARCRKVRRGKATMAEYRAMDKEKQSAEKDGPGFVGGFLARGLRRKGNVARRSLITLDLDDAVPGVWDDFTLDCEWACVCYPTHSSTPERPRLRMVLPLSRDVSPEEYEPIARYVARAVGIGMMDPTTYQVERLFYWPSCPRDVEYECLVQDGPAVDAEAALARYDDWRDVTQWPRCDAKEGEPATRAHLSKAGDPREKPGIIGAFCRVYDIAGAIARYLPEVYVPGEKGRFTYAKGSTANGLAVYDGGLWAYSNHATDPAARGGYCVNAFDLVRIHLFGAKDRDDVDGGDPTKAPSFRAMEDLAGRDPEVNGMLAAMRAENARQDFEGFGDGQQSTDGEKSQHKAGKGPQKGDVADWLKKLDMDPKTKKARPTIVNATLILENDERLKGRIYKDEFMGALGCRQGLPWRRADDEGGPWTNDDDHCLRKYLEQRYGYYSKEKLRDALGCVGAANMIHPIREWLLSLEWDGAERLDRLIIDYLGADDTPLNRAITRKHFTAAAKRACERRFIKYDQCLVIAGEQDAGKSALLKIMAGQWFNNSVSSIEGQRGMEALRRAWIVEFAELASLRYSEAEAVKAFITRDSDQYRPAYKEQVENYRRQCVFCGTTNEEYFLKGLDGNRRFWVIRINPRLRKWPTAEAALDALEETRDQLWAEAVFRYKAGEKLFLEGELNAEMLALQEALNVDSDNQLRDDLLTYLETRLPGERGQGKYNGDKWRDMTLSDRRMFYRGDYPYDGKVERRRDYVTAREFVIEFMGLDPGSKEFTNKVRDVSRWLKRAAGWEYRDKVYHLGRKNGQKGFVRMAEPEPMADFTEDDDL